MKFEWNLAAIILTNPLSYEADGLKLEGLGSIQLNIIPLSVIFSRSTLALTSGEPHEYHCLGYKPICALDISLCMAISYALTT